MTDREMYQLQKAAVTDLLELGLDDAAIEAKHRLPAGSITAWLEDAQFTAMLRRRIDAAAWRVRIIAARNAAAAANGLAALTQSGKDETRRKACLAIVGKHRNIMT